MSDKEYSNKKPIKIRVNIKTLDDLFKDNNSDDTSRKQSRNPKKNRNKHNI